jgi:muramoyltetrapeptide carboxypeptidase LdcA involved in peptidoglycan recycling
MKGLMDIIADRRENGSDDESRRAERLQPLFRGQDIDKMIMEMVYGYEFYRCCI